MANSYHRPATLLRTLERKVGRVTWWSFLRAFHERYRFEQPTTRDFDRIKKQMLFMLTNHAQPYIYVLDGNYRNRGELYLGHRHIGVDLDIKYATETLKAIQQVWGRPVHIHANIDDSPMLFSYDGKQSTQQHE